jgi:hypothetical protein
MPRSSAGWIGGNGRPPEAPDEPPLGRTRLPRLPAQSPRPARLGRTYTGLDGSEAAEGPWDESA